METVYKTIYIPDTNNCSITPVAFHKYLDKFIVGQSEYKQQLSMAVYKYLKHKITDPLLVIGPSGSGKTYAIELLKSCPLLPKDFIVISFDASRLTLNGFSGDDISTIFNLWRQESRKRGVSNARGIVYLDEIDKLIMPNRDKSGENINALIQYQLMNYIAGTKIDGVDTSKLLFVLGGAFVQLDELMKTQKADTLGFKGACKAETNNICTASLRENLIDIGAQREFLGRITKIVRLNKLNKFQLKALLLHPQNGILAKKQDEFAKDGLSFSIADDVIENIVEMVVNENLGARSVKNIVEEIIGTHDYYMFENNFKHLHIHSGVLLGNKPEFFENAELKVYN